MSIWNFLVGNSLPITPNRFEYLGLSREEVGALATASPCPHCGGFHYSTCPYIKSIKQNSEGTEIVFNERFAELVDEIVYDSDIKEAAEYYASLEAADATD